MPTHVGTPSSFALDQHGLTGLNRIHWNLPMPALVEEAVRREECQLSVSGSIVARTGEHTGRSPKDKFVVQDGEVSSEIWWGSVNQPMAPGHFRGLLQKMVSYYRSRDAFVVDAVAGADPATALPIRVVTEQAWHALFSRNLFRPVPPENLSDHRPAFTILQAPGLRAVPEEDGTRSGTFIVLDLSRNLALIGGSSYAGEIKKTIFTVMNYVLPRQGVLSMHCSANIGAGGETALFFGLSGTGKTTLSSDPGRDLIGDDEHGWGPKGIFNIEGGCYAKMIRLRSEDEPLIWDATHRFGAVLENVVLDPETRIADFDDDQLTENTRGAYPVEFIRNYVPEGRGGHPTNVFFLTADAFGVMPPIARLDPDQAMYYFLSGYTSKLAGTEKGLGSGPQATFSTCFGAPFLPLPPGIYAELLGRNVEQHATRVWLVNTGWTGGPYGEGRRIKLGYTRAMVRAALDGSLDATPTATHPVFGLEVPRRCPGVPEEILDPRQTWADPDAYDRKARELAGRFNENFKGYLGEVPEVVAEAGPRLTVT